MEELAATPVLLYYHPDNYRDTFFSYLCAKELVNEVMEVKREGIDLKEGTFKILSLKAVEQGTNLKAYIEKSLDELAENIEEAGLYQYLKNKYPIGEDDYLSDDEQNAFEKEMG